MSALPRLLGALSADYVCMKIIVSRNKLVTALGVVRMAIPTKTGTPIMNHVLMETTADSLTLTCTNLAQSLQVKLDAHSPLPGQTTTDAALLYNIVKSLPDPKGDTEVELQLDKAGLNLRSGPSKYRLGTSTNWCR